MGCRTTDPVRFLLAAGILVALALPAARADTASDAWTRAYRRTEGYEQRLQVMQSIVALDNPDVVPLLVEALQELLDVKESRTANEQARWDSLARAVVGELGALRAADAGPLLYRAATEPRDPYVRSEAMAAIGAAGATDWADELATPAPYPQGGTGQSHSPSPASNAKPAHMNWNCM